MSLSSSSKPGAPLTPARRRVWRLHAAVLGGFLLLAALLWWPLPRHFFTHVPGIPQWAYDEATFVWNIWFFKHAAIDTLTSPLHSELVYFPVGVDLILYTYNFFHVLQSLPVALALWDGGAIEGLARGLPAASNLSLLLSTALSGYGAWLLVRALLAREPAAAASAGLTRAEAGRAAHWAALVAGIAFAYASNRSIYAALGHYDMVTTQWIPFYALALLRSLDGALQPAARRRAALLAGVFFAFTGLAEMITALFLAIFTLIVLLAAPATRESSGKLRPLLLQPRLWLPSLAWTGAAAFVIWIPALLPILAQFRAADFALQGWGEAIPLSADLTSWFRPTVLHPLLGGDVASELRRVQLRALEGGVRGLRDINTVFLGWATAALAAVGAFAWGRRTRIWWVTALLFGLFTLGPFLQINGEYRFDLDGVETTLPLPFALLHWLPVIKANRAPNRNSVLLMLALAVLVGYGLYWLQLRLAARSAARTQPGSPAVAHGAMAQPRAGMALPVLAAALILFEHLVVPLPLSDFRVPAAYATIAADPRPVSVLQAPLGWRNSFGVFGPEMTLLQYFQSGHAKPMLGGNTSRAPDFKMEYFERLPYFQALADIQFGRPISDELRAAAVAQAPQLAALYNIGYVLLHPPVPNRPPYTDTWQETWAFIKATLPLEAEPFWTEAGIEAYRVLPAALPDAVELDLGADPTLPNRGEGWEESDAGTIYDRSALWALEDESRLFVALGQVELESTYRVTLAAHPFAWPGGPQQSARLEVNGGTFGAAQPLAPAWGELTWEIPGSALQEGLNRLSVHWGYSAAPRDVLGGSRAVGSTGATLPVDVDLKAFAGGGFIALFDEAGAQSDASAGRQGVNVTVLDGQAGTVRSQAGFDTTANAFESDALAAHLAVLEPGALVLVASSGDAGAYLNQAAVDALRALGADVTLAGLQGTYFAIAGVQGAAPGTAAQAVDASEAFLRISLDRDRRPLAAAVDWLRVERVSGE